jgi:hypothetical protein
VPLIDEKKIEAVSKEIDFDKEIIMHYEELRQNVLEQQIGSSSEQGWAVLVRSGMLAWSKTLMNLKKAPVTKCSLEKAPLSFANPIISILATMVQYACREVIV